MSISVFSYGASAAFDMTRTSLIVVDLYTRLRLKKKTLDSDGCRQELSILHINTELRYQIISCKMCAISKNQCHNSSSSVSPAVLSTSSSA